MKKQVYLVAIAISFCFILSTAPSVLRASLVIPPTLVELSQRSDVIFHGKCIDVRTFDVRMPSDRVVTAVEFTFDVTETVKGDIPSTFKFVQYGGPMKGMPYYKIGEDYLLFLTGESPSGFRSPLGLMAGAFKVVTDSYGTKSVVNGLGNQWLTDPAPLLRQKPAARRLLKSIDVGDIYELDIFIGTVKNLKDEK